MTFSRRTFLASLAAVAAAPLVPPEIGAPAYIPLAQQFSVDFAWEAFEGIPENPLFDTADVTAIYLRQSMATILDNRDRVLFEAVQRG